MDGKTSNVSRSGGYEGSGSGLAYFVDGINDSSGIFSPEIQSDFSIPLVIDECCYLFSIGGSGFLRSKAPPLLEDVLLCDDGLLIMDDWRG